MSNQKRLILLATAICLLHTSNATVEVVNQKSSVHSGYLMIDSYSFKNGIMVHGVCNGHREQINCTIVLTKHPYANSTYSCNVTLNAEKDADIEPEIYSRIGLSTLGEDKAIIFWHEEGAKAYFKVATVQLQSCEMKEVRVVDVPTTTFIDLFHSSKILTYKDDTYDVVFQDPKLCGEDKACKMSIDGMGKMTAEPKPYITTNGQFMALVSPIANQSPDNGFVYTIIESAKSMLWIIKPDGTEKQLAAFEGYRDVLRTVSSIHDLISVCARPKRDSEINCTQFDKEGETKFNVTLTGIDDKTQTSVIHNLPKGGFLLMLVEYEKCDHNDCVNEKSYRLVKYDENGKQVGKLPLKDFESVTGKKEWAYIYDNGDDKFCAVLVGNELSTPHGDSHIVSNCFTNADFSK